MWPFRKRKVEVVVVPAPRPAVPPPPKAEPIDPNYPKVEYQLEDTGEGNYYIRRLVAGASAWHYLRWTDTRHYFEYWHRQMDIYHLGAPDYKSDLRLPEGVARDMAKKDAEHLYTAWQKKQRAGTIIDLGKLP